MQRRVIQRSDGQVGMLFAFGFMKEAFNGVSLGDTVCIPKQFDHSIILHQKMAMLIQNVIFSEEIGFNSTNVINHI